MGCFWSPDALFGSQEGVLSTRVGYAGGSSENPTYCTMGDHIETVQLDFDPEKIAYADLLEIFFSSHNPVREPWKRQYAPAVFYHNPEQERWIYKAKKELEERLGSPLRTEINPYTAFYLAEERHQKYKLQRQPLLLEEFRAIYPRFEDFINSTAVARVNGYLYGCGSRDRLIKELPLLGLSSSAQRLLLETATHARGRSCA